ncbi:hypothetical protein LTR36_010385 [Oleoguttula mirabilis]|uniref:chitinase n=1 Tax=Oleoguttula mirabilis TaxID=1507867 RepID=A0AAV9J518_9PEZI|nr:hypothetical protein LTR36_010385 [Oleoguttula mirabilis]
MLASTFSAAVAATTSMSAASYPYANSTGLAPSSTSSLATSYPIVAGKTYTASYNTEVTTTITVSGTAEVVTSTIATYSLAPTAPAYEFRADAEDNLAVYYGHTPNTEAQGLIALCEQADVDIVILSFLNDFFSAEGQPTINLGPACYPANAAQQEAAPGLLDCPKLATQITGCQTLGKKVLLSLGGYLANTSFVSDNQAIKFAETLWDLFGAGRDSLDLRPFGPDVVIDGFDIDNENHNTTHYNAFATELRKQFAKDTSKEYYLSAAPQCPIPDESIPLAAMKEADFVWVQFYNNPICNVNSTGFKDSFEAWSKQLSNGTRHGKPRLYIGAPGFAGAGSGYVNGSEFANHVKEAKKLNVKNLGGVMLWDGSEGMANVDEYGASYLDYAKAAVQ